MFVLCGFALCVIALLWYVTTPNIITTDKNHDENSKYVSMNSPKESESQGNGTATIISVNGSPVAMLAIKTIQPAESYA